MESLSTTITVPAELEKKLVHYFDNELDYMCNSTGCPSDYAEEVEIMTDLLDLLGWHVMAKDHRDNYAEAIKNEGEE